ncbi:unnamed protein product [Orchesella dallaii]|uniref:Uncharacterized protein n=1 Tax=Orchesella dallaii TaxID=48710 RepID=A0ABP1S941_9HEXA
MTYIYCNNFDFRNTLILCRQTAAWIAVEALIGCLFILIIIIRIVVVRIKNRKLKVQTGQHTVIAQQPIVSTVNVEQQLGNFGASPFNLRQQCAIATPIPQMTQWSSEKSQPPTYYTYS